MSDTKTIPKFNETFIPIFEVLSDDRVIHYRALYEEVESRYYSELPEALLHERTKSGQRLLENRIGWGKSYLKKAGFIRYPQHAHVQITEKGKHAKAVELTLKNVTADMSSFFTPEQEKARIVNKDSDATPQDLIDDGIGQIEQEVKEELLAKLKEIDPFAVERIILVLLKKTGFGDFMETSKTGDGGIDGIIYQEQLGLDKIYIQAQRYNSTKVRERDIRNFTGAMSGGTQRGIFVTTSTFYARACDKVRAACHKIILLDGGTLWYRDRALIRRRGRWAYNHGWSGLEMVSAASGSLLQLEDVIVCQS